MVEIIKLHCGLRMAAWSQVLDSVCVDMGCGLD